MQEDAGLVGLARRECLFMRGACVESDNEEPENAQGASLGLAGQAGSGDNVH